MSANGRPQIDYTNKDYASLREAMLELAGEKLPAWTDRSDNDLGVVVLELQAYVGDILLYYIDRLANESYLATAVERRSVINLLRLIGYELRPPQPASADLTLLFKSDAAGSITIDTGTQFQSTAKATGQAIGFQYVGLPLTLALDGLPLVRHQDGKDYKRYETLPVLQVDDSVTQEVLGSSDASAAQRFALARVPLIEGSLTVTVDEGVGPRAWVRRSSLIDSLPGDEHYVVQRDENDVAWIQFGDGARGKIPRQGHNNLAAGYRVGGGARGNVAPNTISKAVTPIDSLKIVLNKQPASGGADRESSEDATLRGPQQFRAMDRAVTARDYEFHAREFGVGKARARAAGWNRIDLFVAPAGGGQPTDTLRDDLRAFLDDKRMMTSILRIQDPVYTGVRIEGNLEVEAYYFTEQVQQRVQDAVSALLNFDHVDFQATLYLSKVYEAVEAIEGVASVNITCFSRADAAAPCPSLPADGTLRFGWSEIPVAAYPQGIHLNSVRGGRRVG